MSEYIDPTQASLDKAKEKASIVTDNNFGISASNSDPFNTTEFGIPIAHNANPNTQRAQAFPYQPLASPDTANLHACLPSDKQIEIAEQLLRQQLHQNDLRFQREMENEEQKVTRSKMIVFAGIKIAKWLTIVLSLSLAGLIAVLGITGYKAGSLSDASILNSIVSFFGLIINAMITNSSL